MVRSDLGDAVEVLLQTFLDRGLRAPQRRVLGGRGDTVAVALPDGTGAVLRRNLRGGVPAWFLHDLYIGCRPRPFAEIVVAEHLREQGVAVVESLGAIVRRVGTVGYRGAVATREVKGSVNLWEYVQGTVSPGRRRAACDLACRAIGELHRAGAIHPDLNLTNFLIAREGEADRAWVVDFDGVRLGRLTPRRRRRAWERVRRSARRLDPEGKLIDPSWLHPPAEVK